MTRTLKMVWFLVATFVLAMCIVIVIAIHGGAGTTAPTAPPRDQASYSQGYDAGSPSGEAGSEINAGGEGANLQGVCGSAFNAESVGGPTLVYTDFIQGCEHAIYASHPGYH